MFFKQRKKDLSEKLEYLGYDKKSIDKMIKESYNFLGIFTSFYLGFEERINQKFNIKKNNEILKTQEAIYKENKKNLKMPPIYYN